MSIANRMAPGEILEYERRLLDAVAIEVAGTVVDDTVVAARGFLPARRIKAGQAVRVIDIEGRQVADIIVYDLNNLRNCSSMTNTQLAAGRWQLGIGDSVIAKFGQKMLTISDDKVGRHSAIGGFCSAEMYEGRFGIEGAPGCRANLAASMRDYGFAVEDVEEGCLSAMMSIDYRPDGSVSIEPPVGRAGDYVEFRADMDVVFSLSNCPAERDDCNGWNPTPLRIVTYDPYD